MEILFARIDNRLLHGIVAAQWAPILKCNRLMVIDDKVANDPILKESMRIAKPIGMSLSIITLDTAITNFKKGKYNGQKIFVVTKKPEILMKLLSNGIDIRKVNIGGSAFLDDEVVKLSKRAAASERDLEFYNIMKNKGIEIVIQYVPNDAEVKF